MALRSTYQGILVGSNVIKVHLTGILVGCNDIKVYLSGHSSRV